MSSSNPTPPDALKGTSELPVRVKDEMAWELVRDEWELLIAIGSGPTSSEVAASGLKLPLASIERRLQRLLHHGLVRREGEGYALVSAFYERREGMSSYVRDLVLRRLKEGGPAPISGRVRFPLGDASQMEAMVAKAEQDLFPEVVRLASLPESPRSERFSIYFASTLMSDATELNSEEFSFRTQLLSVLKAAAQGRSLNPDTRSSYLWIAEMRTDPEIAIEIGELIENFVDGLKQTGNEGVLAFAVLPTFQTSLPTYGMGT